MNISEVAEIRKRIDQEARAMHRLMYEPAIVSRHEVINHKIATLGVYHKQLTKLVGEEQAGAILGQAYADAIEAHHTPH
jgi:hypothetical protein